MNLRRGFLRTWIVLTALWFVVAYIIIVNLSPHQSEPSNYFYNQILCRFEGLPPSDPRLGKLQECVAKNEAIMVKLPDGTAIFGDPQQTVSSRNRALIREAEKRKILPQNLLKCVGNARRRGVLDRAKQRSLTTCDDREKQAPIGFELVDPEKNGFWHRVDVPVSDDDRNNLKQKILADFEPYQSKKRWERIKDTAVLIAKFGLAPPVTVLLLGLMVSWAVRGFRN